LLGVPDEYTDRFYPLAIVGESDSLMNSSNIYSKLYPRHLEKILEPRKCRR
ncbi:MAG: hypothetical protein HY074_18290, partial [Deltaproteobacteria bacterium]|nr:hypothetical protein [Deltaproteobacteria bacterium]